VEFFKVEIILAISSWVIDSLQNRLQTQILCFASDLSQNLQSSQNCSLQFASNNKL
jgi:hypothetical protein